MNVWLHPVKKQSRKSLLSSQSPFHTVQNALPMVKMCLLTSMKPNQDNPLQFWGGVGGRGTHLLGDTRFCDHDNTYIAISITHSQLPASNDQLYHSAETPFFSRSLSQHNTERGPEEGQFLLGESGAAAPPRSRCELEYEVSCM